MLDLIGHRQSESPSPSTIRNLPGLRAILDRAQLLFRTKIVVISILTTYQQIFLADIGMPEGVVNLPRATTFCGHTILSATEERGEGLVVLDTKQDWR